MNGALLSVRSGKKSKGFTLIEVMVTVVIIAIIASIAFPAYQQMVLRSHRSDAIDTLATTAQLLERRFTETNSYTGLVLPATSTNGYYTISANVTAASYTLTATATGRQAKDTECLTFTIDNTGQKTATTAGVCW
ncbi:type IV pilin protein [Rheinheimera sp. 4Y26]|uniref:type IV pilin protein n=1 Tax=Rheinheimera sp. 4Y26 TaxID=2977811 RepID=UPI0021B0B50B|nr:type IV pilin protein [Rheinheimera sp. 4Y26]MCT6699272.1 prepilin-type N-terminal cleavage/methylation domain-containing protein [Rheinheimera sp. 4Y26]